jgi:quinolinate synthase
MNQILIEKALKLKKEKKVVIFAHNYQRPEIQEIADVIGDSLYLADVVRNYPPGTKIIYATVKFMAETAAILNPSADIYFPVADALCPMAKFGSPDIYIDYKKQNPNIPIVLYINSTTEAKRYVDVICTSSNAMEITKKIMKEFKSEKIGFGPDKNLGKYIAEQLNIPIDLLPENGHCYVHNQFKQEDIHDFRKKFPTAKILVHPECIPEVTHLADFVGSTSAMFKEVVANPSEIYGIGTEIGLIDRLKRENPGIEVHSINSENICYSMKKFTIEAIIYCMENLDIPELKLQLDESIREEALIPIEKMFTLMKSKQLKSTKYSN